MFKNNKMINQMFLYSFIGRKISIYRQTGRLEIVSFLISCLYNNTSMLTFQSAPKFSPQRSRKPVLSN